MLMLGNIVYMNSAELMSEGRDKNGVADALPGEYENICQKFDFKVIVQWRKIIFSN